MSKPFSYSNTWKKKLAERLYSNYQDEVHGSHSGAFANLQSNQAVERIHEGGFLEKNDRDQHIADVVVVVESANGAE